MLKYRPGVSWANNSVIGSQAKLLLFTGLGCIGGPPNVYLILMPFFFWYDELLTKLDDSLNCHIPKAFRMAFKFRIKNREEGLYMSRKTYRKQHKLI